LFIASVRAVQVRHPKLLVGEALARRRLQHHVSGGVESHLRDDQQRAAYIVVDGRRPMPRKPRGLAAGPGEVSRTTPSR
jgi:hypothetical protein